MTATATIAERARENAIHCEAKKHAYRQTQDGVVVSFVLHPQDIPEGLATASLGTRYMLALVEVGDNEEPKAKPEILFTCLKCEANYFVDEPTDECPVCFWKRRPKEPGGEAQGHAGHMAILPTASRTRTGGPPLKERRPFDTLLPAQQAGIWCSEPAFWKFLEEKYPVAWNHYSASRNRYVIDPEFGSTDMVAAGTVRHLCGVNSRGSIKPDNPAWRLIVDSYPIWKRT